MDGIIDQLITLTAFGNHYLASGLVPADFISNKTFQFCNKVSFRLLNKGPQSSPLEKEVAADPSEWVEYLKTEGCKCLRLSFRHSDDQSKTRDYQLAGFVGGGGVWLIESVHSDYSRYWMNRWEVANKLDPAKKFWAVTYNSIAINQPTNNFLSDLVQVKSKLQHSLTDIADFALKHGLTAFAHQFGRAKTVLDDSAPEQAYFRENLIPPESYTMVARQLLFSAVSSWVFGGMGSWNDQSFENSEDRKVYDTLSERLYSDIIESIIAAINSY